MTVPFFGFDEGKALESLALNIGDHYPEVTDFLLGDHWRGGDGWMGPAPDIKDKDFRPVMMLIEKGFVSRNVVEEIAHRHSNGVIGKPPRWRWTPRRFLEPGTNPTPDEIADVALIESYLTTWWDERETSAVFQQAVINTLGYDRGPVRLLIPDGVLTLAANGQKVARVKRGDIPAALDLIWPEAPHPSIATVFRDEFTMRDCGIVRTRNKDTGVETLHLCYLDGAEIKPERTIERTIGPDPMDHSFNLGGRLLMNEITRPRLITPQIIQEQKALNLALSMVPRTVVTAGFLERAILAGQMPGEFVPVTDSTGKKIGEKFVADPPTFGAGTTNYIAPIAVEEDDGKGGTRTVLTNPDIKWREPSDPKAAVAAKVSHYQDMLEESDQAHILIQSDATPSGMSREQARSEYEGSLNKTKPHVDKVGRWFLETLLALAEELAGVPGKYTTRYRALFEANVDSGPLTPDEKRQNIEASDKGYMSKQKAMELNGEEDPDAEDARMKAEGAGNVGQMVQRATALKLLSDAQFPVAVSVKILGFPEELHADIIAEVEKAKAQDQANTLATIAAKAPAPSVARNGALASTTGR